VGEACRRPPAAARRAAPPSLMDPSACKRGRGSWCRGPAAVACGGCLREEDWEREKERGGVGE